MGGITNTFIDIYKWAEKDYRIWPLRFVLEMLAWVMSLICSIVMAATVPTPPFLILYPLFIIQCVIFAWAAWTRRSSGMMANYILLVTIDSVALVRLLIN